ncbi:MAG: primosomal protein N', partial [Mariniphaga sp.]
MPDLFVQVVLPLPLHDSYTYRVPEQWIGQVTPGQRVVVQFGSRKLYAALVVSVSTNQPSGLELKQILEVLDEKPVVFPHNLELWKWMADYYCCTLGDVFRAALPPG